MSVISKESVTVGALAAGALVLGVVFSRTMDNRTVVEAPRLRYGKDREEREPNDEEIDYLTFKEAKKIVPYYKERAAKRLDALDEALQAARAVYADLRESEGNSDRVYEAARDVKSLGEDLVEFARNIYAQDKARLEAVRGRR